MQQSLFNPLGVVNSATNLVAGMNFDHKMKILPNKKRKKKFKFCNYNTTIYYWHQRLYHNNVFLRGFTDMSINDYSDKVLKVV